MQDDENPMISITLSTKTWKEVREFLLTYSACTAIEEKSVQYVTNVIDYEINRANSAYQAEPNKRFNKQIDSRDDNPAIIRRSTVHPPAGWDEDEGWDEESAHDLGMSFDNYLEDAPMNFDERYGYDPD